jgi:radical SAM protein with 4Fe4S-binding SPASM domain
MAPFLEKNVIPYVDENYWLPLFNETAAFPERDISRVGNVGNYHAPVDPLPCWSVFTACHVLSDGKMSACCHDAIGHWIMGDLKTQSFMEAWHSEEYTQLRKAHLAKDVTGTRCVRCIDSTRQ